MYRLRICFIIIFGVSLSVASQSCETALLKAPLFKTTSVCHSSDIKRVYLGRSDGQIDVHNLVNGKPLYSFKSRDEAWGMPLELVLSQDEHTLYAYYSNYVIVRWFNRAEQKLVLAFQNPEVLRGDLEKFHQIIAEKAHKKPIVR